MKAFYCSNEQAHRDEIPLTSSASSVWAEDRRVHRTVHVGRDCAESIRQMQRIQGLTANLSTLAHAADISNRDHTSTTNSAFTPKRSSMAAAPNINTAAPLYP